MHPPTRMIIDGAMPLTVETRHPRFRRKIHSAPGSAQIPSRRRRRKEGTFYLELSTLTHADFGGLGLPGEHKKASTASARK